MLKESFYNANDAFKFLYDYIMQAGQERSGTKSCFDVSFVIENPLDNYITVLWRKWKIEYAEREWLWYVSGDPSVNEIGQHAKIWNSLADENGNVNSNYGYQWCRGNQLAKVIELLRNDPNTRKASISLYDGKEIDKYKLDTVCTYAINFYVVNNKLNMQVLMRSNDLVFGFCNDQYCFSRLQKSVSTSLMIEVGTYFHYACNMHIYERHFNLKK